MEFLLQVCTNVVYTFKVDTVIYVDECTCKYIIMVNFTCMNTCLNVI